MRLNSFDSASKLAANGRSYSYFRLAALEEKGFSNLSRLPRSLKILLENLLRHEDGINVTTEDILAFSDWLDTRTSEREIAFSPARVLMQDFTGVPAVADLAAMRSAIARAGYDPELVNPQIPVDLIIDHSVQVDSYGSPGSFDINVAKEMERNSERYTFLRWGQNSLRNFRVVPPGTGICHQVNLEYLAKVVWKTLESSGQNLAYPDTLLGTDSHTTMINGLGVLGWGVGGIEAEAALLGQPVSMLIPEVVGVRLDGTLQPGVTATDLVLTVTELLRSAGVVGKFVEFFGSGLDFLPLADRATIANMAPEYGATCGYFPVDRITIDYLRFTGRDQDCISLTEIYAKEQGLWRDRETADPLFTSVISLDMATVVPCISGPRRPQDRVPLPEVPAAVLAGTAMGHKLIQKAAEAPASDLTHGDVVIAAITSCTNTSNPGVMIAAGLLARKAVLAGLKVKPWVKTSLAPGSRVVMEYLQQTGLYESLVALGFDLTGYGCTTCIGNSGPLPPEIEQAVRAADLSVAAVLSGNRNFEGRIHPLCRQNWLASPPLVVAFALAGTTVKDLTKEPLGLSYDGKPVFLRDLWPSREEIDTLAESITPELFTSSYAGLYNGTSEWRKLQDISTATYPWQTDSTYVIEPPFLESRESRSGLKSSVTMRILAMLGDSITTDHISPAGDIPEDSPAGRYLAQQGVSASEFNSYGSRRGNHEVMMRGTFANIRLKNEITPGTEGGYTRHYPDGTTMFIHDAAEIYRSEGVALVVIAGKEYGSGSSRDWAAKGPLLLGVRAVIAESFERIHRSNLIGMGIMPLQFEEGVNRKSLALDGSELVELHLPEGEIVAGMIADVRFTGVESVQVQIKVRCRLDTETEVEYFRSGGILPYVMKKMMRDSG